MLIKEECESFGIWKMNVTNAARLVAIDMCINGYINDVKVPEEFQWDIDDPTLNKAFKKQIAEIKNILIDAVLAGRLKVKKIKTNILQELIPDDNYIDLTDLQDWLADSGYDMGNFIKSYLDKEIQLSIEIEDEVKYRRALKKKPRENNFSKVLDYLSTEDYPSGLTIKSINECSKEDLYEACRLLVLRNNELAKENIKWKNAYMEGDSVDESISPQAKRRLNNQSKVIAAMAFDGYSNPLDKAGPLTGILVGITDELECGLSKDTVLDILNDAAVYIPQDKREPKKAN